MQLVALVRRLSLCLGVAGLAGACQPPTKADHQLPAAQWAPLPATYRPIDRTDTLGCYWAPDSLRADTSFSFTAQNLGRVAVRVRLLAAAASKRQRCDTLSFRPRGSRLFSMLAAAYVPGYKPGYRYEWDFGRQVDEGRALVKDARGIPTRVQAPLTTQLILLEYVRPRPGGVVQGWYDYTTQYPFLVLALARASDSVVYVRAYPVRQNVRQPAAYYTYAQHPGGAQDSVFVPHYADQVDSSRVAIIQLSLHKLPTPR